MKAALPTILIVLLLGQVAYLPVTVFWLEARRAVIAQQYCINQGQPELMCQGSCFINQVVADAMENGPADEMPPASVQKEPTLFSVFLPVGLALPPAPSETFSPQPYFHTSILFFTLVRSVFRPPRFA
ncbi:MAG: hypothetical protein KDD19_03845 [Phaeodactylibacter sp.]|nr:hypothetical protein [Phaeodactylibacter sp.]MCB9053448.1 hypothetical protein [Lewinellaceae bacterium]